MEPQSGLKLTVTIREPALPVQFTPVHIFETIVKCTAVYASHRTSRAECSGDNFLKAVVCLSCTSQFLACFPFCEQERISGVVGINKSNVVILSSATRWLQCASGFWMDLELKRLSFLAPLNQW